MVELEDEAIWTLRECAAAFERPVMLFSIGKDSTALLHLARKAFLPGQVPFPVLHIDTTWKFREMITFRDQLAREWGIPISVFTNQDGVNQQITPFSHSSDAYTRVMKTEALRTALSAGGYDVAIGGARRDEEKSRAKERVFSLRGSGHQWDPRAQRPEFWTSPNTTLTNGQTMRAFPLSNWTELDVWRYIKAENLAVVDLYFARQRPTVVRDGKLLVVDDDRFQLNAGEEPIHQRVRFRTLGCYPLSAAELSEAESVDEIISELEASRSSERAGRLIDGTGASSMESKKREGYF